MHAGGEPNTVADPLLETAERMPPASWQRALTGTLLNVGVVALWASEINLMRAIEGWCTEKDECPWKHPIFLGVALKMVFVLVLPPALAESAQHYQAAAANAEALLRRQHDKLRRMQFAAAW